MDGNSCATLYTPYPRRYTTLQILSGAGFPALNLALCRSRRNSDVVKASAGRQEAHLCFRAGLTARASFTACSATVELHHFTGKYVPPSKSQEDHLTYSPILALAQLFPKPDVKNQP